MKKVYFVVIVIANFILQSVFAQNFINRFKEVGEMQALGDILFFVANDGILHGTELWRSDGTREGTYLVKDIVVGSESSDPAHLTVFGNEVYFSAFDEIHGTELWKSDGTEEGTIMVANIKADDSNYNSSFPANFTPYLSELFFTAKDSWNDANLWKTDGTEEGTLKVFDHYSDINNLTVLNEMLYFVQESGLDKLWKYDGTTNDSVDIPIDEYYTIAALNAFHNSLYFITHTTNKRDVRLYKLNPENDSFILLKEFTQPQYGQIDIGNFTAVKENVFFSVLTNFNNETDTDVLWKTNGTIYGTEVVKSFEWNPNLSGSFMGGFINYNDKLYFRGTASVNSALWNSDGTESGTYQVFDVGISSVFGQLTASNGLLFFCGNGELWQSDGTASGTLLFADLNIEWKSNPAHLTDANKRLYFSAKDDLGPGLWSNLERPGIKVKAGYNTVQSGETVNFMDAKVDEVSKNVLKIENTGLKELVISGITVSGNQFFVGEHNNLVAPGETELIDVFFFPNAEGNQNAVLTLYNNHNFNNEFVLHLSGKAEGFVIPPAISPDEISLINQTEVQDTNNLFTLTKYAVDENLPPNTLVASFKINGGNTADYTFSFVSGTGDQDNPGFTIQGASLYTNKVFDFKFQNTAIIRVKAEKNNELAFERYFIIRIQAVNGGNNNPECGKGFTNLSYAIFDADFVNDETVFAVGDYGILLKSTNAGKNWEAINSGIRSDLHQIQFVTEQVAYVRVGYNAYGLMKTENGGDTWFPLKIKAGSSSADDMHFVSENEGFVVAGSNVFKTVDGGRSWTYKTVGYDQLSSVYFINNSVGFVCGKSKAFYRTTDAGENWETISIDGGSGYWYRNILFTDQYTGYLLTDEAEVIKTTDGGSTWAIKADLTVDYPTNMYFVNKNVGYVIGGWYGLVMQKTEDGGETWEQLIHEFGGTFTGMAFNASGQKGCVVGTGSSYSSSSEPGRIIIQTEDNGNNWQTIAHLNCDASFYDLIFFEDNSGYMLNNEYNENGELFKTYDKGITWTKTSPDTLDFNYCYYINKDTVYVKGDSMYLSTDGGMSWKLKNMAAFTRFNKYIFIDFNTIFYERDGDIFKSTDAGESWTRIFDGGYVTHFSFLDANLGFVFSQTAVFKTDDGGATWHESDLPPGTGWIRTICVVNENIILAGGLDRTFIKSYDGGNSWTFLPSIMKTDVMGIQFVNDEHGYALCRGGGSRIYETFDAGETWVYKHLLFNEAYNFFIDENEDVFFPARGGIFHKYSQNLPPSQAAYIIGDKQVCQASLIDYNVVHSEFYDHVWEVSNNQAVTYQNSWAEINWQQPGEYTITTRPVNGCGEGAPQTLTVVVQGLPEPSITGKDSVSQAETNVVYESNSHPDSRLLWYVEGEQSASILNENQIGVQWGNSAVARVDLIHTTDNGCRAKSTKTIVVTDYDGLGNYGQNLNVDVYPNPVSGYLNIQLPDSGNQMYSVYLYSELGKIVYQTTVSSSRSIDISELPPGMYLLYISDGKKQASKKVMKY